jgi:transposase-like protein
MNGTERRKYSRQFKLEALALVENGERSMSDVERELGITKGLLTKWRDALQKQPKKEEAFPGNGKQPASEARLRQLERENARLRMEKEILKKVLGMYSKDEE